MNLRLFFAIFSCFLLAQSCMSPVTNHRIEINKQKLNRFCDRMNEIMQPRMQSTDFEYTLIESEIILRDDHKKQRFTFDTEPPFSSFTFTLDCYAFESPTKAISYLGETYEEGKEREGGLSKSPRHYHQSSNNVYEMNWGCSYSGTEVEKEMLIFLEGLGESESTWLSCHCGTGCILQKK